MKNVNQADWQELIKKDNNAVVVDVRTKGECAEGIIKNAIMIDFLDVPTFKSEIEKLDKSKNYYVYCRSGNRSGQACQLLDGLGVNNSFNLTGGMLAWTEKTEIPL